MSNQHRIHVFADLSQDQQDAVKRIPDSDSKVYTAIEASRPASYFLDEAQFQQEQASVFRRQPVPLTVGAYLQPNSALSHDAYGLPLLIMRNKHGEARVFLNACTHKGSTLIDSCTPVKASRVTCPYHAWSFDLSGKLIAVALEDSFINLDKNQRHLKELPSKEAGGLLWVILDPTAEPDFSAIDPQLTNDFEALDLPDCHVFGQQTFHLKANWKQVLEPFLEGYHVKRLHAQSVGPLFEDVQSVTDRLGDHLRQSSGKKNFSTDDLNNTSDNIHKVLTFAYQVFPNTVVVTSPWYISVMIIIPNSVGATTVDYYMLTLNTPDNEKSQQLYQTSYDMVLGVFGNEDFKAAEKCYKGLVSGAIASVVYSGMESAIPMYYETLDRYLAR